MSSAPTFIVSITGVVYATCISTVDVAVTIIVVGALGWDGILLGRGRIE